MTLCLSAKVTEACVLTDDEFLTKAPDLLHREIPTLKGLGCRNSGSIWILYRISTIFWMHVLRLKAREKEALDGTTMILCLLWPEVPQAQAKGRCRQEGDY